MNRIADDRDFRRWHANGLREGEDGSGVRFGAKAGIISGNELQNLIQTELARVSPRGEFGVIGDHSEPITPGSEKGQQRLRIADRGEMPDRRIAQKPIDLGKELCIRGPPKRRGPKRAEDAGRLGDEGRIGQETLPGFDKTNRSREASVGGAVAAREMLHHRLNRRTPGTLEVNERAILVEQDCTDGPSKWRCGWTQ